MSDLLGPGGRTGYVRPTSARRPRAAAVIGLIGWALSFLVLPAAHLLDHQDDHVHLPGGGVARLGDAHAQAHARGLAHHHQKPTPMRAFQSGGAHESILVRGSDGDGLLHFGAATLASRSSDAEVASFHRSAPIRRPFDGPARSLWFLSALRARGPPLLG